MYVPRILVKMAGLARIVSGRRLKISGILWEYRSRRLRPC